LKSLQQRKENVALLSVVSNSVLVVFKTIVGILIGSVSIISEAIHSGMDLLAAVIAMFSVKKFPRMMFIPLAMEKSKASPVWWKHCLLLWPRSGLFLRP
jgi:predicted Co/Zn/Cd cation transporter (cation efflux family)